jgi:branched-subunit amino acid transport protein
MNIWVVVVSAGILCFALRISMVALLGRVELPTAFSRALRFVAPATLSALLVTSVMTQAHDQVSAEVAARVIALAIAVAVALRTRSHIVTIAVGMPALWIASFVLGA